MFGMVVTLLPLIFADIIFRGYSRILTFVNWQNSQRSVSPKYLKYKNSQKIVSAENSRKRAVFAIPGRTGAQISQERSKILTFREKCLLQINKIFHIKLICIFGLRPTLTELAKNIAHYIFANSIPFSSFSTVFFRNVKLDYAMKLKEQKFAKTSIREVSKIKKFAKISDREIR